ncbi:unnamed protein product [Protopolystoma xenopodis]|uniref:Uncharacterized protein n=1 Tax=Protopolystoma xenopodis TaxID=117903 RepID=A0A3S5A4S4_9PLAT|nr:unnamed protein product [Protopolystoma xenopodis]
MINQYEIDITQLLRWIQEQVQRFDPNFKELKSLQAIKQQLAEFTFYIRQEKPPKYQQRSSLEARLFEIKVKQKNIGMTPYLPSDAYKFQQLDTNWTRLERVEYAFETRARRDLQRYVECQGF